MSYFEDLTEYTYCPTKQRMLNVGWLASDHSFPRGPVSEKFAMRLSLLMKTPVNIMRGLHYSDLCTPPQDIIEQNPSYIYVWEMNRRGFAEVRVKDSNGTCFSAPELIWHYIMEHQYQPPQEFIDAVIWAIGNPDSQPNWDEVED